GRLPGVGAVDPADLHGDGDGGAAGVRAAGVRRDVPGQLAGGGGVDPGGGADVLGDRPAGGEPGADAGGGVGADEPGDAADVGAVGGILLVGAVPGGGAAVHQGVAADAADRRVTGGEPGGGEPGVAVAGAGDPGGVGGGELRAGPAVV